MHQWSFCVHVSAIHSLHELCVFGMVLVQVVVNVDLLKLESFLIQETKSNLGKFIVCQNKLVKMFPASHCQMLDSLVIDVVSSQKEFSQLREIGLYQPQASLITDIIVLQIQLLELPPFGFFQVFDSLCLQFIESDIENSQVSPRYLSDSSGSFRVKIIDSNVQIGQMIPICILKSSATFLPDIVLADI